MGDSDTVIPSIEVKGEHDTTNQIKDEDADQRVQLNLPDVLQDDIFDDVDVYEDDEESEYVDQNFEGIVYINSVEHFVCPGFKIRQLPTPVIVKRPLKMLYNTIVKGNLILDPNYQRDSVWDETRASTLITSVLMGYFIPPIILNVKTTTRTLENGQKEVKHTRICVDGKQRLTSLHKFMSGEIGFLDTSHPPKRWYYCDQPTGVEAEPSERNICPEALKRFFDEKVFCCYEYDHLSQETEETMFQLVQRGVALTPAEKMRAMSTEWARFARLYEDDYSLVVNLSKQNRASGFRLILTIFTMIQEVMADRTSTRRKKTTPSLQASPQALMRILEDPLPISLGLKLALKDVFDRFEGLVKKCSTRLENGQYKVLKDSVFGQAPEFLKDPAVNHVRTFSPVETVASGILIAYHMDKRTDDILIEDLKKMRRFLRERHKDLRVNGQCWATLWEFISQHVGRDGDTSAVGLEVANPALSETEGPSEAEEGEEEDAGDGEDSSEEPMFPNLSKRTRTRKQITKPATKKKAKTKPANPSQASKKSKTKAKPKRRNKPKPKIILEPPSQPQSLPRPYPRPRRLRDIPILKRPRLDTGSGSGSGSDSSVLSSLDSFQLNSNVEMSDVEMMSQVEEDGEGVSIDGVEVGGDVNRGDDVHLKAVEVRVETDRNENTDLDEGNGGHEDKDSSPTQSVKSRSRSSKRDRECGGSVDGSVNGLDSASADGGRGKRMRT